MGTPDEGSGMGGCRLQDVGYILQGSGISGVTLRIRDVGDVPMHK